MNLQQMRCVVELQRQDFGISATARKLNMSQPAITKQLRQLERELGAELVVRNRNRIEGVSALGRQVFDLAREVCVGLDEIARLGRESSGVARRDIRIAATHAQAKFVLPGPLQEFSVRHKSVEFELREASPEEIVALVASGRVDLGVSPALSAAQTDVLFFPYRSYPLLALAPKNHPLSRKRTVTLETLASYPIITTGPGQVGRLEVVNAFTDNQLDPKILLGAPNFDVVKACVERGLGLAILPSYTYDENRDRGIRVLRVNHVFPSTLTNIVIRKNFHAPLLVHAFLQLMLPGWRVPT